MFDDLETLIRVAKTFTSEQEWSSLAGWVLFAIVGVRLLWPIVKKTSCVSFSLVHNIYSKFNPPVGPVCSTLLEMLEDPEAQWDENGQELMCDGMILSVQANKKRPFGFIKTGHGFTWSVLPTLTKREVWKIYGMALETISRVKERDRKALEQDTLQKLNGSRTILPVSILKTFKEQA